ncbi:MAG: imelysin family protein [Polyangiaceae bacterium]
MSRRKSLSCWVCLSACCGLLSCGNTGAPERNYGSLLQTLTEQVILPEHQDFATQADALVVSVQALSDKPSAANLKVAQAAWREARRAWRVLDAVHIGPVANQRIAERIDVSPVDADGIETIVTGTAAVDDHAVAVAGGKKKGFLGLEYVLFSDPAATAGTPAPALAEDDAAPRRRTWALSMADEVAQSAHQLDDAWEGPSSPNYAQQVEQAGAGSTQYATQRAAVDDLVAGGVAYALEYVVGTRLGKPLGRSLGGVPELDPTVRSDNAVADMQATLSGVAALYAGDGFSSAVKAKKADLDAAVVDELNKSKDALDAIPAPFADAIVNHTQVVSDAYDTTKALKTTWNTDVSSALGAIPKPSDTDGD